MTDQEFHILLKKYLKGESSQIEERMVEEFYLKNQEKTLLDDYSEEQEQEIRGKMKEHIFSKITTYESNRSASSYKWLKIAASVIILLGIGLTFFMSNGLFDQRINYITKETTRGQKSTLELSDGTKIRLNAGSTLIYPEKFGQDTRKVVLRGEAFFDVARDESRPFVIESGEVETTVLGTSFNISAFDGEDILVTVASGTVSVESHLQKSLLTAGQQAVYHLQTKKLATKKHAQLRQVIAWKDGLLVFQNAEMDKVVKKLSRWYNVDIRYAEDKMKNCRITAEYKNETLANILRSFQFIYGIEYEFISEKELKLQGGVLCK